MKKTIAKSISWAVVSGIIIGITAYVETANLKAAFVTALVSALLKTPIYSLHELAWGKGSKKKAAPCPACELRLVA